MGLFRQRRREDQAPSHRQRLTRWNGKADVDHCAALPHASRRVDGPDCCTCANRTHTMVQPPRRLPQRRSLYASIERTKRDARRVSDHRVLARQVNAEPKTTSNRGGDQLVQRVRDTGRAMAKRQVHHGCLRTEPTQCYTCSNNQGDTPRLKSPPPRSFNRLRIGGPKDAPTPNHRV